MCVYRDVKMYVFFFLQRHHAEDGFETGLTAFKIRLLNCFQLKNTKLRRPKSKIFH